ncbi:MAG: VOC family protein [Albidovulum sp.]|nr:VOC family protein [Albidovulum sp.]MDE0533993.1 VOC family protein [Albidovulum sp.]
MLERIVPNLAVVELSRSIEFYRRVLEFEVVFIIDKDKDAVEDPERGVFAMIARDGQNLMLQTCESLKEELPIFEGRNPTPGGTIYFRGIDPQTIARRVESDVILKGPFRQWYGMRELYLRDPDGHIVCVGIEEDSADE